MKRAVSLLALVAVLSLVLVACEFPDGDLVYKEKVMSSNNEFEHFISEYNSKNDGFTSSFISFDFDENKIFTDKTYVVGVIKKYKSDIYDKTTYGTSVTMYFYFIEDDYEYKIKCSYHKENIKFYIDDRFEIEKITSDEKDYDSYYFVDKNDYLKGFESNEQISKYNYAYPYALTVNGDTKMSIKISTETEVDNDKLNEICQLLLDNIVILE